MQSMLADGLKALFWQVAGLLSWSQWAVAIGMGIFALSLTLKLPDILFSLVTLPFRLKGRKGNYGFVAALMTLSLFGGAFLAVWWRGSPPPPPREVVQRTPVRLPVVEPPKIKLPDIDLSGIGPGVSDFLSKVKLPEIKEDPEKARRDEEERLAREKKRLAAEVKARALAKKRMLRARNEWAKSVINAEIESGMQSLAVQEEMRRREEQAWWAAMTQPRVVAPSPPVIRNGR